MTQDTQVGGPDDGHEKYGGQAEGEGDLLTLLENHDKANAKFYEVLRLLADCPAEIGEIVPVVNNKGDQVVMAWGELLQKFSSEHDWNSQEFLSTVTALWLDDEKVRVELLNELAPDARFTVVADGNQTGLETIVRQAYQEVDNDDMTSEKAVSVLKYLYIEYINTDLDQYLQALKARAYLNKHAEDSEELEEEGRLQIFARSLGGHALDVLKLAGVSIGIAVGSLFRGKRS